MWFYGFRGLVALAALSLLATGCTPTAVKADLHAGGKVVVVNALESTVANQHMGITAFGNYNEALVNDWAIPQHAADSIVEALRSHGVEAVAISAGALADALGNPNKLNRALNPRASGEDGMVRSSLKSVMSQTSASVMVVLRSYAQPYTYNSTVSYSGYGVMSMLGFKPDEAMLYANVSAMVLSGSELTPAPTTELPAANCRVFIPTASLKVGNLKDLKVADLEPFREQLQRLVDTRLMQDIVASGLIAGQAELCR